MAYSFEFLSHAHTAEHFRSRIAKFLEKAPDGWPCWSFSNHDVQRHATRWTPEGGDSDDVAKQSIALLASFPGTLNVYQGEELGQTETDIEFDELMDTANIDFWPEYKGRDGCRTPMVWDSSEPYAGFSDAKPWLPIKAKQAARAMSVQANDADSVLNTYRRALRFRKDQVALRFGTTEFLDLPEPILGINRGYDGSGVTALFNLSDTPVILELSAPAKALGPKNAEVKEASVVLPSFGYVFLEGLLNASVSGA